MNEARVAIIPAPGLAQAIDDQPLLVVGFCAAWCNTCEAFETAFDALAAARRDATFVWLDIEDDADVAGDVDVENFPTIALYRDRRPVHFGVSLPQSSIVSRLLDAVDDATRTIDAPPGVATLPARLASMTPAAARRAWRGR